MAKNNVTKLRKYQEQAKLQRKEWLTMPIDGDYIFACALSDPQELQASIITDELGDDEVIQANAIIECIQNILPPKPDPDNWRFLIRIGDDRKFLDFQTVRKNQKPTRVGEYRSRTLSLAPRDWYEEGQHRLIKRFYEDFFGHKPSLVEMESFILNPKNFAIDYEDAIAHSKFRGPRTG